jgi:hypothetical protein
MRVPQVSERIKEAPAQALRGVFAGIGQLLLITDKLRNKTPSYTAAPRPRTPEPAETVATETVAPEPVAPEPVAPEATGTGNVRLVTKDSGDSNEPLPNYGELSLPSLRARLRNLDAAQLRRVTEYERAHEARAEVIAMFERRIAKLEAEPEAGA